MYSCVYRSEEGEEIMNRRMRDFRDGVADGLLYGERKKGERSLAYKQGYDFGLYLYNQQLERESA